MSRIWQDIFFCLRSNKNGLVLIQLFWPCLLACMIAELLCPFERIPQGWLTPWENELANKKPEFGRTGSARLLPPTLYIRLCKQRNSDSLFCLWLRTPIWSILTRVIRKSLFESFAFLQINITFICTGGGTYPREISYHAPREKSFVWGIR